MIFRPALFCVLLAGALTGCGGDCGPIPFCFDFRGEDSKADVMERHRFFCEAHKEYEPVGYQGSDATHHHYIIRPIDWFIDYRIPKTQLKLRDERPLLKSIDTHYRVNPAADIWEPVDENGKRIR